MEGLDIWNGLDKLAFYENTIILESLQRSQGASPVRIGKHDRHHNNSKQNGEIGWVSDFVDDFALISAGRGGASNVTAACLEREDSTADFFTLRVAKNEAFNPAEVRYLEDIISTMNKVKNGGNC